MPARLLPIDLLERSAERIFRSAARLSQPLQGCARTCWKLDAWRYFAEHSFRDLGLNRADVVWLTDPQAAAQPERRRNPGATRLTRKNVTMKMTGYRHETAHAASCEPNLSDVLNDPVVRAVMRADGVNPDELARILRIAIRARSLPRAGEPFATGTPSGEAARPIKNPERPPERSTERSQR